MTDETTETPPPTPDKPKNARKQDVTGFGDRESVTPLYDWMLFGVCNVSWAQLQSAAFAELTSGNPIDEAIATVRHSMAALASAAFVFVSSFQAMPLVTKAKRRGRSRLAASLCLSPTRRSATAAS